MNDKMRAEFEAAAEEHFWLQELRGDYDKAEQEYLDEIVQTAWEFWQLSREVLVIEFPARLTEGDDYAEGWNHALTLAGGAVRGAGVRVKP